tara:strand:+ start:845 stop:1753 length:909 start_codon:yes stop_codon:yes gene_type:complete
MKLFLKYISRFLIFLFTVFLLIVIGNYWLIQLTPINFPYKKNILVLGDSVSARGVNDKIFKRSVNFSSPAESYYYSYLKLKKILETKQAIDTILLSFSPHNIFDNTWFASQSNIQHNFCRYYPLMSSNDFSYLRLHPKSMIYSLRPIALQFLKNIFRKITRDNVLQLGKFDSTELDEVVAEELQSLEVMGDTCSRLPKDFNPTNIEITYLNKITQLCRQKELKLILINLPKHMELLRHKRYGMEEFKKVYNTEFNQLDYFDFSSMLMEDEMYVDLVHLNKKGSSYFSNFLESFGWQSFRYVQ